MEHLLFFLILIAASAVFAALEVQIEGNGGWAHNLPTWRVENFWTRTLLGGRPLTGYHLGCHLFVLVMVHLPYGFGVVPSLRVEARLLAFLVLFWILEDFLWFVFNPAYGVRAFVRQRVPWHARAWWGIMPREYWWFTPVGIALYIASYV